MYKTGAKTKWQRRDSNLRPRAYESPALPLSYAANKQNIAPTRLSCQFLFYMLKELPPQQHTFSGPQAVCSYR